MIHEGLLHRVQLFAACQSFDRPDFSTVRLHGEHQTRPHRLSIHNYGTGAADTVLAADVCAGLSAILADRVGQSTSRLNIDRVIAGIDGERDRCFLGHACFSTLRKAERTRCGVAGISSISTPNGDNASLIALITAAGAPMVPPSPRPLALVREFRLGVSM